MIPKEVRDFLDHIESACSKEETEEVDSLLIDGNVVMLTPRVKEAWMKVCELIDAEDNADA